MVLEAASCVNAAGAGCAGFLTVIGCQIVLVRAAQGPFPHQFVSKVTGEKRFASESSTEMMVYLSQFFGSGLERSFRVEAV